MAVLWLWYHNYGYYDYNHYWLVVSTYPSEKYESVGMMTFPTDWKNKVHVIDDEWIDDKVH